MKKKFISKFFKIGLFVPHHVLTKIYPFATRVLSIKSPRNNVK